MQAYTESCRDWLYWKSFILVFIILENYLTIKVKVHVDKNHLFQFRESLAIKRRDVEQVLVIPGTKKAAQQKSGKKLKNYQPHLLQKENEKTHLLPGLAPNRLAPSIRFLSTWSNCKIDFGKFLQICVTINSKTIITRETPEVRSDKRRRKRRKRRKRRATATAKSCQKLPSVTKSCTYWQKFSKSQKVAIGYTLAHYHYNSSCRS